jgi:hypothetical protein
MKLWEYIILLFNIVIIIKSLIQMINHPLYTIQSIISISIILLIDNNIRTVLVDLVLANIRLIYWTLFIGIIYHAITNSNSINV